jgi:hypothetical protein
MTAAKPARHWCSCGRGFYNKAGCINHGRACAVEVARSAAFIRAIEEGRSVMQDPAAIVQLPQWDVLTPAVIERIAAHLANLPVGAS